MRQTFTACRPACGRHRLDQFEAVAPMRGVDGDVFLADLGGTPIGGANARLARLVAHRRPAFVERHLRLIAVGRVADRSRRPIRARRRRHPPATRGRCRRRTSRRSAGRAAPAWRGSRARLLQVVSRSVSNRCGSRSLIDDADVVPSASTQMLRVVVCRPLSFATSSACGTLGGPTSWSVASDPSGFTLVRA